MLAMSSRTLTQLDRLPEIRQARQALLYGGGKPADTAVPIDDWIERSWSRCLAHGHQPARTPVFDSVTAPQQRSTLEANHALIQAARPVLDRLGRAIADTRYFAILTNHQGVVIATSGAIDRNDRRADLITRLGTDLSEQFLATTAIGAALTELQPVWLHRGEHFFEANAVYSCAGAPLFGPDGHCIGMLDLTGIEVAERPELKHLVAQSARSIENALTLSQLRGAHDLLLRLNWPGRALGDETDGLVCLDADGFVLGANQTARQMVPWLNPPRNTAAGQSSPLVHCSELFALAFESLIDAARRPTSQQSAPLEVPLWTGLRLHALPVLHGSARQPVAMPWRAVPGVPRPPLRELETALIRQAVADARGNVLQAAKALGVSRATVYRRLGTSVKVR